MNTAVIKLDPLPNTVRPTAQNHYLAPIACFYLVSGIVCGEIVGRILHAAYRHRLPRLYHAQRNTPLPDIFFRDFKNLRQIPV